MAARPSNHDDESAKVFCRSIILSYIREKRIRLPLKFSRVYQSRLSTNRPAELCLRNGAVWKVDVIRGKEPQDLWLKKGWSDFMEGNSIEEGFFLTFEYDGGSRFNVGIFDNSTTEIIYPPPPAAEREPPSQTVQGPPAAEREPPSQTVQESELEWNAMRDELSARGIQVPKKFFTNFFSKMSPESKKAMREAIASKLDHFPSFIAIIQPALHRNKVYYVTIPTEFASLHMEEGCSRVNLKAPGREFNVRLEEINFTVRILGADWTVFYNYNMLKRGDVCLFHLLESRSRKAAQFRVSIFRA